MSRPPLPPPLPPVPPRAGLFRQTPPAAFTPVFGLFGLGLAWRRAAEAFALPSGAAEILLGAVTLLYLFVLAAYLAKAARRPGVVAEDLRVLPGRAGLSAASLSLFLLAATVLPYSAGLARWLLFAGLAVHALLALAFLRALLTGPAEQRRATPVWHLAFVGFILAPLSAVPLGMTGLATAILAATVPVALLVWALSAPAVARTPAPLRPLLAVHLAPAALFATVAAGLGLALPALAFCLIALVILALLLVAGRWLTAAGFSPLWGAFTFPAAAVCSACLAQGAEPFRSLGGLLLVGATLLVPTIAWRVMRLWAEGRLAPATNAATA